MNAAIYIRTSTFEQDPENQIEDCKTLAISRGYLIEGIYSEQLSGYKDVLRPKYELILNKAHRGEINAVIVWAFDRWVRNRDTLLEDVTILRNCGCKIHSCKESWLEAINIDGAIGRTIQEFLLGLIGSIAELESQRKSERVKIAHRNYKGAKWGRPSVHTNKKKVIFDLRDKGLTMRQIVQQSGLSLGAVHKVIAEKGREKPYILPSSIMD
jgi:DNA invertase Pin-like site-specific DNA recombinase